MVTVEMDVPRPTSGDLCKCGRLDDPEGGKIRTTANFVKFWRRQKWEREVKWDEKDENRIFTSLEMWREVRRA